MNNNTKLTYTLHRVKNDINGNPRFLVKLLLPATHHGKYCTMPVIDSKFKELISGRWSKVHHGYTFSTYMNEYDYINQAIEEYIK